MRERSQLAAPRQDRGGSPLKTPNTRNPALSNGEAMERSVAGGFLPCVQKRLRVLKESFAMITPVVCETPCQAI